LSATVYSYWSRQPLRGEPVTWGQAQEIGRLFHAESLAVPTIAERLSIPYDTCCDVLAGKVWPGSRRYWMDRVLP